MKKARLAFIAVSMLAASAIAAALYDSSQRAAWPLYDLLQRQTAPQSPSDVVLVYITQNALDTYAKNGDPWPWPREYWAYAMAAAKTLEAKSVTFDISFNTASLRGRADDASFNQALKSANVPVVFPGPDGRRVQSGPIPAITQGLEPLIHLGVTTIPAEADGIYRVMPAQIEGRKPLGFARLDQPTSRALRFYKQFPFTDVVNVLNVGIGAKAPDPSTESLLRKKHWVIEAAAPGLLDLKPNPLNKSAPGAEIHATALANALEGRHIDFASLSAATLFTGLISLVAFSFLFFAKTPLPALAGSALVVFFGPALVSLVMWIEGSWLNPLPATFGCGLVSLIGLGSRFQIEWKERERMAKAIENSMSSEMVDLVRSGELRLTRFGERREISIFFCDLSGFTTIAERLEPAKLVDVLNLYLEETVALIFERRGFVDKFIGDAVMALWGAPLKTEENHAALALTTAIDFQTAFERFRSKALGIIGPDAQELTARVGVHSGPAIVGHIGSHARHNYTAVGDSVNLASRLESLGKSYKTCLLLTEDILERSGRRGELGFVELDLIGVKGKSSATRIFTFDRQAPADVYAKALDFYRHARFPEALEVFRSISGFGPAEKMAERCQALCANGSLSAFQDGIWHFDEK